MATMHNEERIGEAWRLHRAHNHQAAIELFEDVLQKTPKNVDAMYGLGLARRSAGDLTGASEMFNKALEIATGALDGVAAASAAEGHISGNDLDTLEDDRYMMLSVMIKQRIAEIDSAK